jgi:hypothetical protein
MQFMQRQKHGKPSYCESYPSSKQQPITVLPLNTNKGVWLPRSTISDNSWTSRPCWFAFVGDQPGKEGSPLRTQQASPTLGCRRPAQLIVQWDKKHHKLHQIAQIHHHLHHSKAKRRLWFLAAKS